MDKITLLTAAGFSCGPDCSCVQHLADTMTEEQFELLGQLTKTLKELGATITEEQATLMAFIDFSNEVRQTSGRNERSQFSSETTSLLMTLMALEGVLASRRRSAAEDFGFPLDNLGGNWSGVDDPSSEMGDDHGEDFTRSATD